MHMGVDAVPICIDTKEAKRGNGDTLIARDRAQSQWQRA